MGAVYAVWAVQKIKIILSLIALLAIILILFQNDITIIQKYKHALSTATLPYCPYPPENLCMYLALIYFSLDKF